MTIICEKFSNSLKLMGITYKGNREVIGEINKIVETKPDYLYKVSLTLLCHQDEVSSKIYH